MKNLTDCKYQITNIQIPVEVSARHVHLSKKDNDILFGENYKLKKYHDVSQPNQFASVETLIIRSKKKDIKNVRIIAPFRNETQVEISITDAYNLGIDLPLVLASGNLKDSSGGIELIGPKGKIKLTSGVIISQRHLHIEPKLAKEYSIKHQDNISILIKGNRSIIFNNVLVRSREGIDKLSFQIDTDEGNACGITKKTKGFLLK